MKKNLKRILAVVLVCVMLASSFAMIASAAGNKSFSGTSAVCTVKTKSKPWYVFWDSPKITVKNTGSRTVTVIVYKSNGAIAKQVTALGAGKSSTISLDPHTTYTVGITPHYANYGRISGTVSGNGYISSVK